MVAEHVCGKPPLARQIFWGSTKTAIVRNLAGQIERVLDGTQPASGLPAAYVASTVAHWQIAMLEEWLLGRHRFDAAQWAQALCRGHAQPDVGADRHRGRRFMSGTLYHDGNRQLAGPVRQPRARRSARGKSSPAHAFTDDDKAFIESLPYFFLATADAEGRPDCSFKGGAPGFVRVTGPGELAFPDYDGNGMFKSLGNLLANAERRPAVHRHARQPEAAAGERDGDRQPRRSADGFGGRSAADRPRPRAAQSSPTARATFPSSSWSNPPNTRPKQGRTARTGVEGL